jgi:Uma2 family endonuclease
MATTTAATTLVPFLIDLDIFERVVLRPPPDFSDDDFFDFCQRPEHELLRIERNAEGDIIVMAPVGTEGGFTESQVAVELSIWAKRDGRGLAFGSNTGIKLPDGSTFSPDAFWITNETWKAIPRAIRKKFASCVPPFVIEVRSPSDRKKDLHEKMLAYLRNGVELGWLIDPLSRTPTVRIYRQSEPFVELENPARLEGEGPVAGFVLDLKEIYDVLDA